MEPNFQTKFLLHLIQRRQDHGFIPLWLLLILGILGLLVMVGLPLLTSGSSCACTLEPEGMPYVDKLNTVQQWLYFRNQPFTSALTNMGFETQSDNYVYGVEVHSSTAVTTKGASLRRSLKNYVGGTVVYPLAKGTQSRTATVICESDRPGAHTSFTELPNIKVNAKGEPTCPPGYFDLSKR